LISATRTQAEARRSVGVLSFQSGSSGLSQHLDHGQLPGGGSVEPTPRQPSLFRNHRTYLGLILLLAFTLRLWGIDFGLPFLYHPDERRYQAEILRLFQTWDFNPDSYVSTIAFSFFYILNAIALAPFFLLARLHGVIRTPADIPVPSVLTTGVGKTAMSSTFILGRLISLSFALGAIILAYLIGKRLLPKKPQAAGLMTALFMAVSPTLVAHSRPIAPDIFLLVFLLLGFYGAVEVLQHGSHKGYVLSALATGFVGSTKANGLIIVVPILAAHFARTRWSGFKDRKLYFFAALALASFLLTFPSILIDPGAVLSDYFFEVDHYASGQLGSEGNTLWFYIRLLLSVEGPVSILAVLGLVVVFRRRLPVGILAATFVLPYFIFINTFVVRYQRTLIPILPFLFLFAITFLAEGYEFLRERDVQPDKAARWIGVVFVLSIFWPLSRTVMDNLEFFEVDTRERSRIWIDENIPSGSVVALEAHAPWVDPLKYEVRALDYLNEHQVDWYYWTDVEYLVFSEGAYGALSRNPGRYSEQIVLYEALFDAFYPLKQFEGTGPEIRVYSTHPP
jgi:4-amino-4-deoxy-L-arabinose transferase-like glycosyltransferase